MSVTNFDASLTTARRRQLALYTWRKEDNFPTNPKSLYPEQRPSYGNKNTGSTSDVSVSAGVGAQLVGQVDNTNDSEECSCSQEVTLQGYVKKSPAK